MSSTTSKTLNLWLTDGSPIPFSDTHQLDAVHSGLLGLRVAYKGLVDPMVPVGSTTLRTSRPDDVLVGEAEWVVTFPGDIARYIAQPDAVDLETPVILQGVIEGKWLNRFLGSTDWKPASVGNNLLAEGPGIPTTLGAIEAQVAGEVRVEYDYQQAGQIRKQIQTTRLEDLRGQNILGLVRAVLEYCRDTGQTIEAIDLGAFGAHSAIVTEPHRVRDALRFGAIPLINPLNLLPSHRFEVMEKVVRGILEEGVTVLPGHAITLTTTDQYGKVVGQGRLTLVA